jgi:hypothetical protein
VVVTFLSREKKSNLKKAPVSRSILRAAKPAAEAAPHAAMRRCPALRDSSSSYKYFGESPDCSGAHNLKIAARLASLAALPGRMMLA